MTATETKRYDLAFRIVGDPATAENVVAEAMLKCWNRVFTFREARRSALGVWFIALTYQAAMETYRTKRFKSAGEPRSLPGLVKIRRSRPGAGGALKPAETRP